MSVILKENEWAEKMIKDKSLGKKPVYTLSKIARYYIDKGYDKREVELLLESFVFQCDPTAALPKWTKSIGYAIGRAMKYEAIDIDGINITSQELDFIEELEGAQVRRLAFTLLCLAKYWHEVNPILDGWVNNKDNEIMVMANISTSIKRQCLMYSRLRDEGLIQFSKRVDNTNVRVLFIGGDDVAMTITDFRNLGLQYLQHYGAPIFNCENCGLAVRYNDPVKGRKQKYCKECAIEIATRQRVNSVMRRRRFSKK